MGTKKRGKGQADEFFKGTQALPPTPKTKGEKMNDSDKCFNTNCYYKLDNGTYTGGWKAVKTKNGYHTGYICKHCSGESVPPTQRLNLYQRNHYYSPWNQLVRSIAKDEQQTNTPNNSKMPEWNEVIDRMEQKRKEAKKKNE